MQTPDHNDTMIDDDDDDNDDNEDASDNDPDYPDGDSNTETKNQNPGLSPTSSTLANNGFSTSVTYGSNSTLESTFSIENENVGIITFLYVIIRDIVVYVFDLKH